MRVAVRWLGWSALALLGLFVLLQAWYALHIWWWRDHPPGQTAFMAMRLSELRTRDPPVQLQYTWVPYERISTNLKRR